MKISIPITSIKLMDLLTESQKEELMNWKEEKKYSLLIQNLWNVNIYLENWSDATVENSLLIAPNYAVEELNYFNLERLYVISETSINNNIRLITI